jgi:hypothetical protein
LTAYFFDRTSCASNPSVSVVRTGVVVDIFYQHEECPILLSGVRVPVALEGLAPGMYVLRLYDARNQSNPSLLDSAAFSVKVPDCGDHALCLQGGRFAVTATFVAHDGTAGAATPLALTPESGAFWFFSSENLELVVKVLNACAYNGHFWVYAGGLTDVQVTLTVRDTLNSTEGHEVVYENSLGSAFSPIRDSSALPCN